MTFCVVYAKKRKFDAKIGFLKIHFFVFLHGAQEVLV
jgi:hypothetical protein